MEIVLYGFLTCLIWAISMTMLLPLVVALKYSKRFRERWFAYVFSRLVKPIFMTVIVPYRKKAFELLNEKLLGRDVTKPLKVLEIGIASGGNLEFYPINSHLTALDVNTSFDSYFKENKKKYPHIVYERTVISPAEDMKYIDDCSMDLVISTYVLCYVNSTRDALKEIRRILKPGGTFLFLEHVGYSNSEWGSIFQKCVLPLWSLYADGCCLLKNTEDVIQKSGFSHIMSKKVYPKSVVFYCRPHTYGIATK